jgi:hypothetical protein
MNLRWGAAFFPIGIALAWLRANPLLAFAASALPIAPLAGLTGDAAIEFRLFPNGLSAVPGARIPSFSHSRQEAAGLGGQWPVGRQIAFCGSYNWAMVKFTPATTLTREWLCHVGGHELPINQRVNTGERDSFT